MPPQFANLKQWLKKESVHLPFEVHPQYSA